MASHHAARRAASLGWKNLLVMPAGIDGWRAEGRPVEGTDPGP
jgi:rhodanese-related sulfurtransferase